MTTTKKGKDEKQRKEEVVVKESLVRKVYINTNYKQTTVYKNKQPTHIHNHLKESI